MKNSENLWNIARLQIAFKGLKNAKNLKSIVNVKLSQKVEKSGNLRNISHFQITFKGL